MAVTISSAAASAACDAVVDLVDADASAGKLVILDDTTTLVTITLADPAFGAASGGQATAAGLPKEGTAVATGTADKFELKDGADTLIASGTVTATSGGGDLEISNTSIATDDVVSLQTLSWSAPTS